MQTSSDSGPQSPQQSQDGAGQGGGARECPLNRKRKRGGEGALRDTPLTEARGPPGNPRGQGRGRRDDQRRVLEKTAPLSQNALRVPLVQLLHCAEEKFLGELNRPLQGHSAENTGRMRPNPSESRVLFPEKLGS